MDRWWAIFFASCAPSLKVASKLVAGRASGGEAEQDSIYVRQLKKWHPLSKTSRLASTEVPQMPNRIWTTFWRSPGCRRRPEAIPSHFYDLLKKTVVSTPRLCPSKCRAIDAKRKHVFCFSALQSELTSYYTTSIKARLVALGHDVRDIDGIQMLSDLRTAPLTEQSK